MYEYRCTQCGYSFEKIQSFSAEPEKVCPKCQGELIRPVTAPALRFEGAGWYVNDYAGKGGAKAAEKANAEGASSSAELKDSPKDGAKDTAKSSGSESSPAPVAASSPAAPATSSTSPTSTGS